MADTFGGMPPIHIHAEGSVTGEPNEQGKRELEEIRQQELRAVQIDRARLPELSLRVATSLGGNTWDFPLVGYTRDEARALLTPKLVDGEPRVQFAYTHPEYGAIEFDFPKSLVVGHALVDVKRVPQGQRPGLIQ